MTESAHRHVWGNAAAYEAYIGRWSRPVARTFVAWLAPLPGLTWLDVGCGTGALTQAVLTIADPGEVLGVDPSPDFIAAASVQIDDPRVRFAIGDARALPVSDHAVDAVVAGLVLNHVPDPEAAVAEMARGARSGGMVAAYVWDYAGQMQLVRTFWQAAIVLDPAAATHEQGVQCLLCHPESLISLLTAAGLQDVTVQAIDVPTVFRDFNDYWRPHLLGGSGIAQRYVTLLGEEQRTALRERLRATLPIAEDGSIPSSPAPGPSGGRRHSRGHHISDPFGVRPTPRPSRPRIPLRGRWNTCDRCFGNLKRATAQNDAGYCAHVSDD